METHPLTPTRFPDINKAPQQQQAQDIIEQAQDIIEQAQDIIEQAQDIMQHRILCSKLQRMYIQYVVLANYSMQQKRNTSTNGQEVGTTQSSFLSFRVSSVSMVVYPLIIYHLSLLQSTTVSFQESKWGL